MKKVFLLFSFLSIAAFTVKAQDTVKTTPDAPLVIYGSVDTYYKYDFSDRGSQIPTSFASDHNSVSIGMIDLGLKKKVGKAAFVGELSFGPRGQAQSIPNGPGGDSFHIQNLYVSYDLTDKLNLTGGYMATFVGYEVIAPTGNFNYSTSYLFTNGPFQNPGVKLTYAFSDKVSLMAGVFNDVWNYYSSVKKVNTFGSQLFVSPAKGWTAYLNVATGKQSGTEFDLTTAYQLTDAFKLGLNAATYSAPGDNTGGFSGVALYPQIAVAKTVTLGLRGEYFKTKANSSEVTYAPAPGASVTAVTFTANIKAGPLTFIPEVRFDHGSKAGYIVPATTGTSAYQVGFYNHDGNPSKSAAQVLVAAVYAF